MDYKTLKLDVHTIKVCVKVSQSMGVIRRVSNKVPDNFLYRFFYDFVYLLVTLAACARKSTYPTALDCLKFMVKKQLRIRLFLWTDLVALLFNLMRLMTFFVICLKLYMTVNIYSLLTKWTSFQLFIIMKLNQMWGTA